MAHSGGYGVSPDGPTGVQLATPLRRRDGRRGRSGGPSGTHPSPLARGAGMPPRPDTSHSRRSSPGVRVGLALTPPTSAEQSGHGPVGGWLPRPHTSSGVSLQHSHHHHHHYYDSPGSRPGGGEFAASPASPGSPGFNVLVIDDTAECDIPIDAHVTAEPGFAPSSPDGVRFGSLLQTQTDMAVLRRPSGLAETKHKRTMSEILRKAREKAEDEDEARAVQEAAAAARAAMAPKGLRGSFVVVATSAEGHGGQSRSEGPTRAGDDAAAGAGGGSGRGDVTAAAPPVDVGARAAAADSSGGSGPGLMPSPMEVTVTPQEFDVRPRTAPGRAGSAAPTATPADGDDGAAAQVRVARRRSSAFSVSSPAAIAINKRKQGQRTHQQQLLDAQRGPFNITRQDYEAVAERVREEERWVDPSVTIEAEEELKHTPYARAQKSVSVQSYRSRPVMPSPTRYLKAHPGAAFSIGGAPPLAPGAHARGFGAHGTPRGMAGNRYGGGGGWGKRSHGHRRPVSALGHKSAGPGAHDTLAGGRSGFDGLGYNTFSDSGSFEGRPRTAPAAGGGSHHAGTTTSSASMPAQGPGPGSPQSVQGRHSHGDPAGGGPGSLDITVDTSFEEPPRGFGDHYSFGHAASPTRSGRGARGRSPSALTYGHGGPGDVDGASVYAAAGHSPIVGRRSPAASPSRVAAVQSDPAAALLSPSGYGRSRPGVALQMSGAGSSTGVPDGADEWGTISKAWRGTTPKESNALKEQSANRARANRAQRVQDVKFTLNVRGRTRVALYLPQDILDDARGKGTMRRSAARWAALNGGVAVNGQFVAPGVAGSSGQRHRIGMAVKAHRVGSYAPYAVPV